MKSLYMKFDGGSWRMTLTIINVMYRSRMFQQLLEFESQFEATINQEEAKELLELDQNDVARADALKAKLLPADEFGNLVVQAADHALMSEAELTLTLEGVSLSIRPGQSIELRWTIGAAERQFDLFLLFALMGCIPPSFNVRHPVLKVSRTLAGTDDGGVTEAVDVAVERLEVQEHFLPFALNLASVLSQLYARRLLLSFPSVVRQVREEVTA